MSIGSCDGADTADSTLVNALSKHALFGLQRGEAEARVRQVVAVAAAWKSDLPAAGVSAADID
jgi:serine/threonine-protein kinase HipA